MLFLSILPDSYSSKDIRLSSSSCRLLSYKNYPFLLLYSSYTFLTARIELPEFCFLIPWGPDISSSAFCIMSSNSDSIHVPCFRICVTFYFYCCLCINSNLELLRNFVSLLESEEPPKGNTCSISSSSSSDEFWLWFTSCLKLNSFN